MFDTLLSSNPVRRPRALHGGLSLLAHVGIVTAAVAATRGATPTRPASPSAVPMVFPASPPPPTPSTPMVAPSTGAIPTGPSFEVVVPPIDVPIVIPPIDLGRPFDPSRFTGRGTEVPPGTPTTTQGPGTSQGPLWEEHQVDSPAEAVRHPRPTYPPALQQAGIEGFVEVRFVVDTTGRVEPSSLVVIRASHPQFEPSVAEAILSTVFRSARVRGVAVRQLVQQRIRFAIGR